MATMRVSIRTIFLSGILLSRAVNGQESGTAAAMTEEWLRQQPPMRVIQLTHDDAAILQVFLAEWRIAAGRSRAPLTIARDLNQYDPSIGAAISRAFAGKVPGDRLAAILEDLAARNSESQTIEKTWTVKGATVVLHRMQMLLEYGAHAPDITAEERLLHFKSFMLPGYDASRARAILVFSQSWEIENPFRGLVVAYLEKEGRSWRVAARHHFTEHENLSGAK